MPFKAARDLRDDDIVIPRSGRYKNIQCRIVRIADAGDRFHVLFVPVIPVADERRYYPNAKIEVVESSGERPPVPTAVEGGDSGEPVERGHSRPAIMTEDEAKEAAMNGALVRRRRNPPYLRCPNCGGDGSSERPFNMQPFEPDCGAHPPGWEIVPDGQ